MLRLARRLGEARTDDRLSTMRWLPPQAAFLRSRSRRKLLRAGNQVYGKTTAGLAEIIYRCLGRHPYIDVPPPPIEAWVLCASWTQSVAIQSKLWDLVPKYALKPGQRFDPRTGFGGHSPVLEFLNGSIVKIKTTKQQALDLSSATIDVALFDEPPRTKRVYAEVLKRLLASNGTLLMTLTPINAPVDYLREECERGKVEDLHFPLRVEYLIPEGSTELYRLVDGTICDQAWIDAVRSDSLPYEEPVVVDGEWETRLVDRMFPAFQSAGPDRHVLDAVPAGEVILTLGTDHGLRAGRQSAVLIAVVERPGSFPEVYVIDEYRPDRATTPDDDAAAIVAMLKRHGQAWRELEYAWGDRPTGGRGDAARKGNLDIEDGLVRVLGLRRREELKPRLMSVKRGRLAGSGFPDEGIRWLHHQMLRPGCFRVHSRCQHLVAALDKWQGMKDDPHKDLIDALRYALRPWILGDRARRAPQRKIALM